MRLPLSFFLLPLFFCSCKKDPQPNLPKSDFAHFYGTSADEIGRQVKTLSDGSIVVCGYGAGPNGGTDCILMKTDNDGNEKWLKYYGGSGNETCLSFDKTADGGFILCASTTSFGAGQDDFYIVKTDADGNVMWTKTYGGIYNDDPFNIRTLANGYFVCGISNNGHDNNSWMLRLNINGDSLWSFNYGGNGDDGSMSSCADANGNHVVLGYTNSTSSNSQDGYVMLLNDSGTQTAYYVFGTPGYEEPHGIVPALDGNGWVICGQQGTTPNTVTHDVFLRHIANNGTELWDYLYGGTQYDGGEDLCVSGNTYGIAARSNSHANYGEDFYFLQISSTGSLLKQSWLGTTADDGAYGIIADQGSFILTGYSAGGPFGAEDIYLMRISGE